MVFMCNPPTEEEEMVMIKTQKEIEMDKYEYVYCNGSKGLTTDYDKKEEYENQKWGLVKEQLKGYEELRSDLEILLINIPHYKFRKVINILNKKQKQLFGE